MNREEFLAALRAALAGLPEADIESSVEYWAELIDDRVEEGLSEAEAVSALGSPEEIAREILLDAPMTKLVKAKMKPKRSLRGWEIALIIIGFPLWLPVLLAVGAVILAVYVSLWSVIVALFSVVLAFAAGAPAAVIGGFVFLRGLGGALLGVGAGLVCAGLAILFWLLSVQAAKGMVGLGKAIWRGIKACFVGKKKEETV
ncbi:MAG: DUF1700 domain-containing protein [Oscillospiraceae bacterium]|nr:DUF1700 domain-containing protein [Oscillospiraceae bacterium]